MIGHDIATCSVVRDKDKYYLFYTDAGPQTIRLVVSDNNMEAFVDGQECLSARVVDRSCYKLAIEIAGGRATIRKPFLHYFRNGG